MAITVVLHGSRNDRWAIESAVHYAVTERTGLRLVLGKGTSGMGLEAHLEKVLRDTGKQGDALPAWVTIEQHQRTLVNERRSSGCPRRPVVHTAHGRESSR